MANEKRHDLIDRKTLAEELSSLSMMVTGLRAGKGVLKEFMEEYRKSVLRIVDEQATVDAVEGVRCKDCKKRYNPKECPMCVFVYGEQHDVTNDDGYCDRGERRSDAETD